MQLPLFIRMIREAQALPQGEVAAKIGISQSALAQYENLRASISHEKISKIAELLNLNPEYVERGIGNPFKQTSPTEVIKLLLPETRLGEVDFTLVELIAEANAHASFFFLMPRLTPLPVKLRLLEDMEQRLIKQSREGRNTLALLIRDGDGNFIALKRKSNLLFDEKPVISALLARESRKQFYDVVRMTIGLGEYEEIKKWEGLTVDTAVHFTSRHYLKNRAFVAELANKIWSSHLMATDEKSRSKVFDAIRRMDDFTFNRYWTLVVPKIAAAMKRSVDKAMR